MFPRRFVAALSLATITSVAFSASGQDSAQHTAPSSAPDEAPAAPVDDDAPPPADTIVSPEMASALDTMPRDRAPKAPPSVVRPVLTAGGGYVYGTMHHPDLAGTRFKGMMLNLGAGVAISRKWVVELEFSTFETTLNRNAAGKFAPASTSTSSATIHPLAEASRGGSLSGGQGGFVSTQPIHIHTVGPRVDFAPLGPNGPFIGLTAGASIVQDVTFRLGGAGAARAGVRWQPVSALALSLEAGAHGQVYSEGSAALPYAAFQATLFLSKNEIR
jgi:hypothetical protein